MNAAVKKTPAKAAPKKAEVKAAPKGKSNLPERAQHKFNVNTLAKDLKLETTAIRARLRTRGVEKAPDGQYGWNTQADYDKVKKSLQGEPKEKAA